MYIIYRGFYLTTPEMRNKFLNKLITGKRIFSGKKKTRNVDELTFERYGLVILVSGYPVLTAVN